MNRKGNVMIGVLMFVVALGVVIALVPVMNTFIDMARQSNSLNCYGYIYNGNPNHPLSFNATLNNNQSGSGFACSVLSLYIPYILLVFLIFGVSRLFYSRIEDSLGGGVGLTQ
jgi:hypothetical protein